MPDPGFEVEADVIVVGGGGAGLAAAVEAADHGARVVLLEKNKELGGTTGMSIGAYTAANTHLQRRKGIHDSIEALDEDLRLIAGEKLQWDNPQLRSILVHELTSTMQWLEKLGITFVGPFPEGRHRVPRMHSAVPSGKAYIVMLTRAARRRRVRIVCSARVTELVKDGSGRVCGVSVEGPGPTRFSATRGVILAAGDFSASRKLKRAHFPADLAELDAINPTSTGDGFQLAVDAGGALVNMHLTATHELRFPAPPSGHRALRLESILVFPGLARAVGASVNALPPRVLKPFLRQVLTSHMAPELAMYKAGAILVNQQGRRFVSEGLPIGDLVLSVASQPGRKAYMVLDAALAEHFSRPPNGVSTAPGIGWALFSDYRRARPDIVFQGSSLRELAGNLSVDAVSLEKSVRANNLAVQGKEADPFGREGTRGPLTRPPFYAMGPLLPVQGTTKGGVAIDADWHVLDKDHQVIPGLYAAGYTGLGGLILVGHGINIGWAMLSGRLAGRTAAQSKRQRR